MLQDVGGAFYCGYAFNHRNGEMISVHFRFLQFVLNRTLDLSIGGIPGLHRIL
jgi:hypothetical protein